MTTVTQPVSKIIIAKEVLEEANELSSSGVPLTRVISKLKLNKLSYPTIKRQLVLFKGLQTIKDENPRVLKYFLPEWVDIDEFSKLYGITDISKARGELSETSQTLASFFSDSAVRDFIVACNIITTSPTVASATSNALFPPVLKKGEAFTKIKHLKFIGCYPIGRWVPK